METHENIKLIREKMGMSQQALAELTGYKDRSSIAKIEAGLVDLPQSKIALFAKVFNVSPAYLMGLADDSVSSLSNVMPMPDTYRVPLIGNIACGQPILATENADETVDAPEWVHADFALRCRGDSMINARIFDGDVVYIRRQPQVENGEIAAVRIGDEATLKRVYQANGRVILRAANPLFPDLEYEGSDLEDVQVLGLAVAFTSTIR